MQVIGPRTNQSEHCAPILRALPDWFGIEKATQRYIDEIDSLPTFIAEAQKAVVGFLSLKQHSEYSAEIYVMGVLPEMHNKGIGRALVEAAQAHLLLQGVAYLQVKTLGPKHPDEGYARTRAFYTRMGFHPLEEFDQIWGPENPCLILVKALQVTT